MKVQVELQREAIGVLTLSKFLAEETLSSHMLLAARHLGAGWWQEGLACVIFLKTFKVCDFVCLVVCLLFVVLCSTAICCVVIFLAVICSACSLLFWARS